MSLIVGYNGNTYVESPLPDGAIYESPYTLPFVGALPVTGPTPHGPLSFIAFVQPRPIDEPAAIPEPALGWAYAVVLIGAWLVGRRRV
jgi:hypothetical protein